ncbi:MAG: hypothetical protein J6V36_02350, partial [Clostridia bacterium]|nr:hypothetical protein [Clostridia bacterium]
VYLDSDKDGVIDTNESGVSYSYENGELKTIQTPSGTYSFAYDEFLNTTSITIGNTTLAEYTYNNFNGKLKTISQNLKVEDYVYDELDRIVEIVYNGVTKYTFAYNGNGTLYSATDKSSSKTYYYEYDALGRLIRYSERNADGTRVVYIQNGYDDIGRASDSKYVFEDGTVHEYDLNYKTNSNLVQSIKIPTDKSIVYQYDALERETTRTLGNMFETYYTYKNGVAENQTSTSIASIHLNTDTSSLSFKYDYDNEGNITHIYEGNVLKQSYEYDELNRLTRENDAYAGKTYVYEYDKNGNRTSKKTYEYTAASLGNVLQTEIYTYGNSNWKDLLTNYQVLDSENTVIKNKNFNFNSAGNHLGSVSMSTLAYDDADMLWEYGCGDEYVHCYYNSDGIRIKKIIYHVDWEYIITIEYILDGSTIIGEKRTRTGENPMTETLYYIYDDKGELAGFTYNGTPYYYGKNIQGDIVSIYDANADLVVRYTYDAWGNGTGITGTLASTIGEINPFRYRGYYFDSESGCYYLISRYYDPVTGRFVTPDAVDVLGIEQANLGQYNLFAYCLNDPVNRVDEDGNWSWKKVLKVVAAVAVVTVAVAAVAAVTAGTGGAAGAALCAASGALKGAAIGAVKGAVSGAISGGATSAIKHRITTGSWKGAGKAALNGAIDGAKSGAASGAVLGAFAGGITSNCFVAGTEILTVAGLVAIENISEGDEVLAENPETGEKGVKRVVQTFVKETYNLVHIYVEDEEIVTTPEHPFWEMNREWCSAIEIRAGDILKLANGKTAIVSKVYSEALSSPVTVYNFEVADFHTYYVGKDSILVHNSCGNQKALPKNGIKVNSSDALDLADDFLGKGYSEMSPGRFVSADGLRQVRMTASDLAPINNHAGAPHLNFEKLEPNPLKPGKFQIIENSHVYIYD